MNLQVWLLYQWQVITITTYSNLEVKPASLN